MKPFNISSKLTDTFSCGEIVSALSVLSHWRVSEPYSSAICSEAGSCSSSDFRSLAKPSISGGETTCLNIVCVCTVVYVAAAGKSGPGKSVVGQRMPAD
jgi:hypothetical protein